jgi:hypothetical protein
MVLPYISTAPWKYFEGMLTKGLGRNFNSSHIMSALSGDDWVQELIHATHQD